MRFARALVMVTVLYGAWMGMMAVHELGHVLHAGMAGVRVERVSVPLWGFSRTDVAANARPAFIAWGGAVLGCVIPLAALLAARLLRRRWFKLLLFFAGFCLIANGIYLAAGSFDRAGDAGDLIAHGAAPGSLLAFGAVTVPLGLFLWHRIGPPLDWVRGAGRGLPTSGPRRAAS